MNAMLNNFDVSAITVTAGEAGRFVFFIYEVLMNFLFLNMLVTIMMDIYSDVQGGELAIADDHEIMDLLVEKIKGPQ